MRRPTAAAFLLAFLLHCALSAGQMYQVTDLGVFGGKVSYATGINDAGQIVGASYINTTTAVYHAFLWTATTGLQDLGTLGGKNSYALGINNAGQVVGCADINPSDLVPGHAFLWTSATGMQDLGSLGGGSCAIAVNNVGQVVGYSTVHTNTDQHAFIWSEATGMQDLGVPASSETIAASINDAGMVVGTYYSGSSHAYLWTQSSGFQDLGNLGIPKASGGGINDLGELVGSSEIPPGSADVYAGFYWTATSGMKRLPSPYPGHDATASAVDSTGEIVGFALNANIEQQATVWPVPGRVFDLNQLTVNSPLNLAMASGVNGHGQIVGVGLGKKDSTLQHAYLATPMGK